MNHLSEEQLVLHYYGEEAGAPDAVSHLDRCPECRALYSSLQRVLNMVDALPVPEPGLDYAAEVWSRIGHRIPARRSWLPRAPWRWAAAAAAFAGLLVAAFFAGRSHPAAPAQPAGIAAADPQSRERVLLVAVGDCLERSQMVLIELANADPKSALDIGAEQARASGLVAETRLYRQTADRAGDAAVAGVLDELERSLLEIAHAPSPIQPRDLEALRENFARQGILFKIRVLDSNLRNREEVPLPHKL
jgi:predicted anti-sigma-YlaC factor YlaD